MQLTWLTNYERAQHEIPDSDLVRTPDNALLPAIAAEILVRGMIGGWFTGKRLAEYFPLDAPATHDWLGAREIVNGRDKAAQIAGYALHFSEALAKGGSLVPAPVPASAPPTPPSSGPAPEPAPPKESLLEQVVEAVERFFDKGNPA